VRRPLTARRRTSHTLHRQQGYGSNRCQPSPKLCRPYSGPHRPSGAFLRRARHARPLQHCRTPATVADHAIAHYAATAPHRIAAPRLTLAQMTPSPRSRAFFCRRLASAPPTPPECPSLSNAPAPPLVSSSPRAGPRALTLTQIPPSPCSGILLRPRRRLRRHHHRTATVAGLDLAAASPTVATAASSSALPAAPASPAQHQHQCQHSISTSDNAALAPATAPATPAQHQHQQ
jgi:hypothetical protein